MTAITVKGTYRFSAQVDPTAKDSPWHSAEVGFELASDDDTQITERHELAKELIQDAKIQVFTQLGVEFDDDYNPIYVVPDVPVRQTPAKKAQRATQKPRTVDTSGLPTIEIGGVEFIDYREAKKSGEVKPRFPDFKTPDNKRSEWLTDQDGQPTEFAKLYDKAMAEVF